MVVADIDTAYREMIEQALEASVYIAPRAPGLTRDELIEVGAALGRSGKGAITRQIEALENARKIESERGRFALVGEHHRFLMFILGRFDPDYRNFDALNFPIQYLAKKYEEEEGEPTASIDELLKACSTPKWGAIKEHDLHVAVRMLRMGEWLEGPEGALKVTASKRQHALPSTTVNQMSGVHHHQRIPRPEMVAIHAEVERVILKRGTQPAKVADAQGAPHARNSAVPKEPAMTIKLFVSHASKDVDLARAFVNWLQGCLEIPDRAVRCTSVPGYRLDPGDDHEKVLRENLEQCSCVLALLTDTSLDSDYVLAELGAGWAFKKRVASLVMPGISLGRLAGPIASRHAIHLDQTADLAQLADVLSNETGFALRNSAQRMDATTTFVAAVAAHGMRAAAKPSSPAAGSPSKPSAVTDLSDAILLLKDWARSNSGTHAYAAVDAALNFESGLTKRVIEGGNLADGYFVKAAATVFTITRAPLTPFVT